MNPKSGKPPTAVNPAEPTAAFDADVADPGEVAKNKAEQEEKEEGKYGSSSAQPHKKDEEQTSWIEIELIDEEDRPVPGELYEITLPDSSVAKGTLDQNGFARISGIESGTCQITFPELDQQAWERV